MVDRPDQGGVTRRGFVRAATGAGAVAGGAAGPAAGTLQEDGGGGNESEGGGGDNESEDGGGGGGGGGGTEEVIVGPSGDLVFDPEDLSITPGTTVLWVWESDNHNVAPTSVPDEADWEGHPDIVDEGAEYEHTFEVEGTYEYVCEPHASAGMEGAVTVGEDAGGGGGGAEGPTLPDSAISLAIGTSSALVATLALAYFFIKYGGYEGEG